MPLKRREDKDYMFALKQDLRETTKKMLYLLTVGDQYQKFVYVLFIFIYMFIYYSVKTEVVQNMC